MGFFTIAIGFHFRLLFHPNASPEFRVSFKAEICDAFSCQTWYLVVFVVVFVIECNLGGSKFLWRKSKYLVNVFGIERRGGGKHVSTSLLWMHIHTCTRPAWELTMFEFESLFSRISPPFFSKPVLLCDRARYWNKLNTVHWTYEAVRRQPYLWYASYNDWRKLVLTKLWWKLFKFVFCLRARDGSCVFTWKPIELHAMSAQ